MPDYNPFLNFLPNYSGVNLNSEFRFYNYTPDTATINPITGLDNNQVAELNTAKTNAEARGDQFTTKIIDSIFKYGSQALLVLGQIGVIKNKNIASLADLAADKERAANVLARTGGSFDLSSIERVKTEDSTATRSTTTDILGIPITYIIVGLVGTVLYFLFKSENKKSK